MLASKPPAPAMVRRRPAALAIAALCPMPRSQGLIQFTGDHMISYATSPGKLIRVGLSHRAPACSMLCINSLIGPGWDRLVFALGRSRVAPPRQLFASTVCSPMPLMLGLLVGIPLAAGSPMSVGKAWTYLGAALLLVAVSTQCVMR